MDSSTIFKNPRWNRKHPTKNIRRLIAWTHDNASNLPADYIPSLLEKYGDNPNLERAHIKGEFCPLTGKSAAKEFKSYHVVDCEPDPHLPFILSLDFNVDPLAWCAFQRRRIEHQGMNIEIAVVVLNSTGNDSLVIDATADFVQQVRRCSLGADVHRQLIEIDGDSQGHRRNVMGYGTPFRQAQDHLRTNGFGNVKIVAAEFNPREEDSIDYLNNAFASGWLYVDKRCTNVITSLSSAQLIPGKKKLMKQQGEQVTHWYDAVKYPVFRWTVHDSISKQVRIKVLM